MSRWFHWKPNENFKVSLTAEPAKPTKPRFEGFEGLGVVMPRRFRVALGMLARARMTRPLR